MINIKPENILYSLRNNVVDEQFFGFIVLYENFSCIKKIGDDNNAPFYLRSLSKPVQASLIQDFNIIERLNFSCEEIAICCGSHCGTNFHVNLVRSILSKVGLSENHLLCPVAEPLDKRDYDGIKRSVYNNCSAKHALMLAICKLNNWDLSSYCDISHPLQKMIFKRHLDLSLADKIPISSDGCGTPVFALNFNEIAHMFFNLFHKYDFILSSLIKCPYAFGGYGRLDTEIIELGRFNLVAKVGAGGFVLIYNIKEDKIFIVKMSQNNNHARRIVTLNALYQLGWIDSNPVPMQYCNDLGEIVGDYICNFSFL